MIDIKWSAERLQTEKLRLYEEISKMEVELYKLKRQLELLEDAIYVFTV